MKHKEGTLGDCPGLEWEFCQIDCNFVPPFGLHLLVVKGCTFRGSTHDIS